MGFLRFLFATSVLYAHAIPGFGGGVIAVPAFYILSGFYMSLVLNEKYLKKRHAYRLFIVNRFLRIFPLYWVILLLLVLLAAFKLVFHFSGDNALVHILNVSHQSPIIFINYLFRNATLIITTDYFSRFHDTSGEFLLVQQAGTLQIELLFYLFAPFLVVLNARKLALFSGVYGLMYFYVIRESFQNTLIHAFSVSLIYFLLGIISYKLYRLLKKRSIVNNSRRLTTLLFVLWSIIALFFAGLNLQSGVSVLSWLYYISLIAAIPILFLWMNPIDIFLGELSYALYLSHFLVIKLIYNFSFFPNNLFLQSTLALCISIVVSFFLAKTVEAPIDLLRARFVKQAKSVKAVKKVKR